MTFLGLRHHASAIRPNWETSNALFNQSLVLAQAHLSNQSAEMDAVDTDIIIIIIALTMPMNCALIWCALTALGRNL